MIPFELSVNDMTHFNITMAVHCSFQVPTRPTTALKALIP